MATGTPARRSERGGRVARLLRLPRRTSALERDVAVLRRRTRRIRRRQAVIEKRLKTLTARVAADRALGAEGVRLGTETAAALDLLLMDVTELRRDVDAMTDTSAGSGR